MSEKDQTRGTVGDIEEQIRKLEREKEELERRHERKRLEERLKLLQDDVSGLKAGGWSRSQTDNRSSGGLPQDSGDLNTSLEDAQARLRTMQQSALNASMGGLSSKGDEYREDVRSSDDADDFDDVMTASHKQALRMNRDVLVDNMTPDDIFNDLISKHILTNADVSRIKEKNTIEAMNEELLNVLIRRSDKAFYVFVASLRRTLQGGLANRLDPRPQSSNSKRKRKTGELNVNVDCEQIVPAKNKRFICTCEEVEEQILQMAKGAFCHIRRRDASPAAFEQFKKELQQTNQVIKESMEIRNTLKELCRHGDLVDLSNGSVCFTISCTSLASCQELWDRCQSGCLLQVFQNNLVTAPLLHSCGAKEIYLCLRISRLEFLTCALELAYREKSQLLRGSESNTRTPMKKRLRKAYHKSGVLGKTSEVHPRQPFKEISNSLQLCSPSPVKEQLPISCNHISNNQDIRCPCVQPDISTLGRNPPSSWTYSQPLKQKTLVHKFDRASSHCHRFSRQHVGDELTVTQTPFQKQFSKRRKYPSVYSSYAEKRTQYYSPYNLRCRVVQYS